MLVIQHVPHERLGSFEEAFRHAGCAIYPLNIYEQKATWPRLDDVSGVVSMGGPMSVYERDRYSWIAKELSLLQEALRRGIPIFGVCLGAQLLAHALGAPVTKNPQKEIGWYPVMREHGADGDPLFEPFGKTETVFQWHSDTFALPKGAVRLASSPLCREQAFRYNNNAYGLQFHLEVTEAMIRAWMQNPVNKAELSSLRLPAAPRRHAQHITAQADSAIDPMAIRRRSRQHTARLHELSRHVATAFCRIVSSSQHTSWRSAHAIT